jgi:hypothetical protein
MSDCAVVALVNLADLPYADAEAALVRAGRLPGQGTSPEMLVSVLSEFAQVSRWSGDVRRAVSDGGRFLVCGRGHCFSVVNGRLMNVAPTPPPLSFWRVT